MERYQSEVNYDPIKVFLVSIFITLLPINALHAASFDCNKAATQTEKAICANPELSSLDNLLASAWRVAKNKVSLDDQRDWLKIRELCATEECLRKEMGIRIGTLLAISDGLEERIENTPFRYIEPKDVFTRCRKNYQGGDVVKYVEILFSFEKDGPTFKETNIFMDGSFSESIWDWLIWNVSASDNQIITNKGSQSILKRSFSVTKEYVEGLKLGRTWHWIIHEDESKGASFTSFRFNALELDKCLSHLSKS